MMVLAIVILAVVSSIGGGATIAAMLAQKAVQHAFFREKAFRIAEAGLEKAIAEIARDPRFAGDGNVPFDIGSFQTQVQALGDHEFEIIAVGHARRSASTQFAHQIVARVTLDADRARIVSWSESGLPPERLTGSD